jgi:hypothetical protein
MTPPFLSGDSKRRAAVHGGGERAVVEIVELAADGDAMSEAGHLAPEPASWSVMQ